MQMHLGTSRVEENPVTLTSNPALVFDIVTWNRLVLRSKNAVISVIVVDWSAAPYSDRLRCGVPWRDLERHSREASRRRRSRGEFRSPAD